MKVYPGILVILKTIIAVSVLSQPAEGVWVSSHELRVGQIYSFSEGRILFNERPTPLSMQQPTNDSLVYGGGKILKIHRDGTIGLRKSVMGNEIEGPSFITDSTIFIGSDTFELKVMSDVQLLLVDRFTDSLWWEEHFYKLPPSHFSSENQEDLPLTQWRSITISASQGDEKYHLEFAGERHLVVAGFQNGKRYTYHGRWSSKWIGSYLFFVFYDYHFDQPRNFYFDKKEGNILSGYMIEKVVDVGEPLSPKAVILNLTEELAEDDRLSAESMLIGKWQAENDPLFYDSSIEFGFLSYQNFELNFKSDSSFSLLREGILLKNGDSLPLSDSLSGKWEMSISGKYIKLLLNQVTDQFLTIEKLTSDTLEFNYIMKTMSEYADYNVFENRRVVMRKQMK